MKKIIVFLIFSGILTISSVFAQQNNQRTRKRNRQMSEANVKKWADIQSQLKQKYPEEFAAIEKTATVNLALAMQKMNELARKANMELPRGMNRMSGGPRSGFNPEGFNRNGPPPFGNRPTPPMGGMRPNQRQEAEKKIKAAYPAEYAAIEKQQEDAETKLQALAKKAKVTLPMSQEMMRKKMETVRIKYKAEFEEIAKLRESDPEAARERIQAILKKEGIAFPNMEMQSFRRDNSTDTAKQERRKFNSPQQKLKLIRAAYPEEMKQAEQLRENDPQAYRAAIRKLVRKYDAEHPQH